jgi:hypothetical protein
MGLIDTSLWPGCRDTAGLEVGTLTGLAGAAEPTRDRSLCAGSNSCLLDLACAIMCGPVGKWFVPNSLRLASLFTGLPSSKICAVSFGDADEDLPSSRSVVVSRIFGRIGVSKTAVHSVSPASTRSAQRDVVCLSFDEAEPNNRGILLSRVEAPS